LIVSGIKNISTKEKRFHRKLIKAVTHLSVTMWIKINTLNENKKFKNNK